MKLDIEKAKAYSRRKYFIALAHLAFEIILLAALMASGLAVTFKNWAEAFSNSFYIQAAFYYAFFFLYFWIFNLGFAYYSSYRVEHDFGLSNQKLGAWFIDLLKKTLLSYGITFVLFLALYFFIRRFPGTWWIWSWLAYAGFSYLAGQLFPVLIVPLFYRYGRVENEELKQRIFKLVERYKLPLENVYSLNLSKTTKKANAMFAGLGRTKRLVLADTLIQNFTPEEIESVVAHELGHYKHRDIWFHLVFSFVTSFVSFALAFSVLNSLAPRLGYDGAGDLAAFPLLYLIFFLVGLVLHPLDNAFSRWREREADRFALEACGPKGFIPAMEKLAQLNLAGPNPHPLIVWWFHSHPPIQKRIEMAKKFLTILLILFLSGPAAGWTKETVEKEESEREVSIKALEARTYTGMKSYFLGGTSDASAVDLPIAIELYNDAVKFFEKREYELAREALRDSLSYDAKNPFAHELLGDIAYYQQKLDEALKHYESAYRLKARQDLKVKIEKIQKEKKVESGLASYEGEHFLIKYKGESAGLEGYELKEYLQKSFREVGQDLGYFFKHKVAVLLYDENEFREINEVPHWSSGVYDGKIRLPAYRQGFTLKEVRRIIRHEMTHAFVGEMSAARCPPWLNEGLAEYEEEKEEPSDFRVFQAAIRSGSLFPLQSLFDQKKILELKDPLEAELFYQQSHQVVMYLVTRYGMFKVKQMLEQFAKDKDSFEVLQEVLKISPLELEERWKETLTAG
jgi:STE24 endopeptidase